MTAIGFLSVFNDFIQSWHKIRAIKSKLENNQISVARNCCFKRKLIAGNKTRHEIIFGSNDNSLIQR